MNDFPDIENEFYKTSYLLPTPCIYKLSDFIKSMLLNKVQGAIVVGETCYGKTTAISYLTKELFNHYGEDLPIFNIDCKYGIKPDRVEFFSNILEDLGHSMAKPGRMGLMQQKIYQFITEKVHQTKRFNIAIIFMDEAQNLGSDHYQWYITLENVLRKRGIRTLFLLFGLPSLFTRRSTLIIQRDQTEIVGRFMVEVFKFDGLLDVEGIKTCFNGYDAAQYPGNNNMTIVRKFFPNANPDSWCLAKEAEKAWKAFVEKRGSAALIKKDNGIPMKYFVLTVENILRKYQTEHPAFRGLSVAQWKEAIDMSGYVSAMQILIPYRK